MNINLIKQMPSCPVTVPLALIGVSAAALAAAYTAQFMYGLEPCVLCLYQRLPYMTVIVLGIVALLFRKNKNVSASLIALSALAFLINAGIASYHVGVEQHWWVSAVEGCAVSFGAEDAQSLLDSILKAPNARCDEIAWTDPVFGFSMAVYNAVLCFLLAIAAGISARLIARNP